MKSILLVRHAKSSWEDLSMADFDRPLNDRGKRDAPAMAERLAQRHVEIDAFVSSPAKRARKTAEIFSKSLRQNKKDVQFKEELYEASEADFAEVVRSLPDDANVVAIFSHNPGITDYANSLTGSRIDNIPTSGIFAVKADVDDWKKFDSASKEVWFFDYPKNAID
jgi:phosphohistidine phosphatase